jgi:hypothetical protein
MADQAIIETAGRQLGVLNPGKVFFPERGFTKLDLAAPATIRRGRLAD